MKPNPTAAKQTKRPKPTVVELKDLKPKINPKAGSLSAYVSEVTGEKQGQFRGG